jgi:hypothetical protein
MKKFIILLLAPIFTYAQTDSVKVSVSQETGTLEKTEIIDNSQYVLKRQEPINHLFKLQIGSTPTDYSRSGTIEFNVTAGYERKFGKAFSVNALLDFWTVDEGRDKSTFSAIIEPRLYLNQKVSNLSGAYLGLKFQQNLTGTIYESGFYTKSFNNRIGLTWGIQNRFLNTGLIDIGITAGFENNTITQPIWEKTGQGYYDSKFTGNYNETKNTEWFIRSEARIGVGFTSSSNKYKSTTCDIFRCFEAQKSWLKIDFTRMFYISENKKDVNLGLDYEFKIGQSAWSINQALRVKFKSEKGTYTTFSSSGPYASSYWIDPYWSGSYSFEPRYYYNLKKRIAYGKSANNLSANYVSLLNGMNFYKNPDGNFQGSKRHTGLVYGVQRRLVKNGFFDVNAGIAKVHDGTFVDGLFPRSSGLFLLLNFKVGYAIL